MQMNDPSNGPNRPHISSVTIDFKERDTNETGCALTSSARPASSISIVILRLVTLAIAAGPSGAPLVHLCAAGEGLSTVLDRVLQVLFERKFRFFLWPTKYRVSGVVYP